MIWKLALLFTIVPAVELALLIWIGTQIGVLWTTAIVIGTGFTGAWLAKREGVGVLRQIRTDLEAGMPPAGRIVEGVMVLVGAVLLVTPGILTDITGFALIIPATRRLLAPFLLRRVVKWWTGDPELAKNIEVEFGKPQPSTPDGEPVRRRDRKTEDDPAPPGADPHFDHPVL